MYGYHHMEVYADQVHRQRIEDAERAWLLKEARRDGSHRRRWKDLLAFVAGRRAAPARGRVDRGPSSARG
jgi:hypothetical protein